MLHFQPFRFGCSPFFATRAWSTNSIHTLITGQPNIWPMRDFIISTIGEILESQRHCVTLNCRAVVVAQLVEWSLPTSDVCGSNPDIGKSYWLSLYWKDENKEKYAWKAPFKNFLTVVNFDLSFNIELDLLEQELTNQLSCLVCYSHCHERV